MVTAIGDFCMALGGYLCSVGTQLADVVVTIVGR